MICKRWLLVPRRALTYSRCRRRLARAKSAQTQERSSVLSFIRFARALRQRRRHFRLRLARDMTFTHDRTLLERRHRGMGTRAVVVLTATIIEHGIRLARPLRLSLLLNPIELRLSEIQVTPQATSKARAGLSQRLRRRLVRESLVA